MSNHTPGPWVIDWNLGRIDIFRSCVGTLIASIRRSGSAELDETAKANARLIAAAPDLLEALRLVMACAGEITTVPDSLLEMALNDGDEETRQQANAFRVARAAIAKAEGRA